MKFKRLLKVSALVLATISVIMYFGVGSLYAEDYYIEKHTETFIDGKPAGGASVLELWVKKDQVRYFNSNDKDNILIIRMDEDKVYQLNEKEKTVKDMDLKAQFAAVEKQIQVSSKKTDEKKQVDQWKAYQVVLTSSAQGVSTEVEYWLSEEIKLPIDTRMRMAAYFGQQKIIEELKKYPGYPVEIVVHLNVQGKKIDMVTKLVKLEKKNIDQQLFVIPSDYTKIDLPSPEKADEVSPQPEGEKNETPPNSSDKSGDSQATGQSSENN